MPEPHDALKQVLEANRFNRWLGWANMSAVAPPKGYCRWCGKPVTPPRRTWCSDECVAEGLIRNTSGSAATQVYQRDKGVCAACGMDCDWLAHWWHRISQADPKRPQRWESWREGWGTKTWQGATGWNPYQSLWQADHIIPVVEGGGCCGLENYRTLCVICHKKDTAALAARRAKHKQEILEHDQTI